MDKNWSCATYIVDPAEFMLAVGERARVTKAAGAVVFEMSTKRGFVLLVRHLVFGVSIFAPVLFASVVFLIHSFTVRALTFGLSVALALRALAAVLLARCARAALVRGRFRAAIRFCLTVDFFVRGKFVNFVRVCSALSGA